MKCCYCKGTLKQYFLASVEWKRCTKCKALFELGKYGKKYYEVDDE